MTGGTQRRWPSDLDGGSHYGGILETGRRIEAGRAWAHLSPLRKSITSGDVMFNAPDFRETPESSPFDERVYSRGVSDKSPPGAGIHQMTGR